MIYAALKWGHFTWLLKSQFLVKIYVLLNELIFFNKTKTSITIHFKNQLGMYDF